MLRSLLITRPAGGSLRSGMISTVGLINNETVESIKSCSYYKHINTMVPWKVLQQNIFLGMKEDNMDKTKLRQAKEACMTWCKKDELWDRKQLIQYTKAICEGNGTLTCLLGGKNTGKSTFLKHLRASLKNVVVLDMRFGTDIKESVVSALIKHHNKEFLVHTISLFKAKGVQLTLVPIEGEPAEVQLGLLQSIVQQLIVQKEKVSLHELLGNTTGHMTLVVDEANLAFNENKVKDWMQAQMDLQAFVAMTKQNRQINVMLVSHDHAFPFRLRETMKFNLLNIQEIFYFGEIPPAEMFELLVTKWQVGPSLAMALVDAYGGHIMNVANTLVMLDRSGGQTGKRFDVQDGYGMSVMCVRPCLVWAEENNVLSEMRTALQAMAKDGYFEVAGLDNKVAATISHYQVGGLVKHNSLVGGFKEELWSTIDSNFICVPSSHSMRLIILNELEKQV